MNGTQGRQSPRSRFSSAPNTARHWSTPVLATWSRGVSVRPRVPSSDSYLGRGKGAQGGRLEWTSELDRDVPPRTWRFQVWPVDSRPGATTHGPLRSPERNLFSTDFPWFSFGKGLSWSVYTCSFLIRGSFRRCLSSRVLLGHADPRVPSPSGTQDLRIQSLRPTLQSLRPRHRVLRSEGE